MSINIERFIDDAMNLYNIKHYDTSLTLICCAIDACAKKQYPNLPNGKRIRTWIDSHINTICVNGLPVIFGQGCKFKFGDIPGLQSDNLGYSGLEDVVYSLIRCSLIHECKLNDYVCIGNENEFYYCNKKIMLPNSFIIGLAESVKLDM